jgi:exodeoxyribonuclease-5
LGLKISYKNDGTIEFKPDTFGNMEYAMSKNISLLILDEYSMVEDYLTELILTKCHENGLKVIFVGDSAQIPPVSQPMVDGRKKLSYLFYPEV